MTIELSNTARRAFGIAVQFIEDMPEELRSVANADDMRSLLAGETCGRDGAILVQAIAIVLAWRTQETANGPPVNPDNPEVYTRRIEEFRDLFGLAGQIDPRHLAMRYVGAIELLACSRHEEQAQ